MLTIENTDSAVVKKERCQDCGASVWRAWLVNRPGEFAKFPLRCCMKCYLKHCYMLERSREQAEPWRCCAVCFKRFQFDRFGYFLQKVRYCGLCGRLFCQDCTKIANDTLCLESRPAHWQYWASSVV